ncbi:MAG TPA: hypothetical protein VHZ97_22335 [Pseudonocardiaceae bacterium]|jgi:hypothetical protein|nr:hypothetical protein [Pseudonocardiaceae bacterium]
MPRLLSRALFVLGGATAATAAAWLLSSGTASADTMPQVPSVATHAVSTSDSLGGAAATPFETPLSTAVSTVADPVTDAGTAAVSAVSVPSQHPVIPLPAVNTAPAGIESLTTGLRTAVGQLGDRLPVSKALPTQLVQHLGHAPVSTPAVPSTAAPVGQITPRHLPMQPVPFAGHDRIGGVVGQAGGSHQGEHGDPSAPQHPGNSPIDPLTVPAMPGGSGSGSSGFAGPAGVGLPTGAAAALSPELHVVDVLAPATEPASVLPGKQPGVTPD